MKTDIWCLKSSSSVPLSPFLLISQRKEFYSAAQTFLCIFLRRSLTIALAVALQEKGITPCSHSFLLLCLNSYFLAGWESYMCFCLLESSLVCINAKTLTRYIHCGWMCLQLLHSGCICFEDTVLNMFVCACITMAGFLNNGSANLLCLCSCFCSWSYLQWLNCLFPFPDPTAMGFIISPWSLLLMPSGNISFTDEYVTQQDLRAFTAPEVLEGISLSSVSDIEKV